MQTPPFQDPVVLGMLAVVGMAGSAFAAYGTLVVLVWVYRMPAAKHTPFTPLDELLPVRGRWLSLAVTVLVTLVAVPLLLGAVFLFLASMVWLLSLLFSAH